VPDLLTINHLEFFGHCGVTEEERLRPQPLAVDVELEYAPGTLTRAATTADLSNTVDYAAVAARILELGRKQHYVLIETLGDAILRMLFREFPVLRATLWIRKIAPQVEGVRGSVGIRLDRTREAVTPDGDGTPAPFLVESLPRLPHGRVLDLACGRGRHALLLASHGFIVDAVDRDELALAALRTTALARGLRSITARLMDLEDPNCPPEIPESSYEVVIGFYYLYRPLFPLLVRALKPGGVLVYETFLIDNHLRRQHPRRKEFSLAHNELLHLVAGLRILHYDEGERMDPCGVSSTFTARLLAQKTAGETPAPMTA
jgi:dihydroneopterin aldolase